MTRASAIRRIAFAVLMATPWLLNGCGSDTPSSPIPEGESRVATPVVGVIETQTLPGEPVALPAPVTEPSQPASAAPLQQHTRQRLSDDRPDINPQRLAAAGINILRSKRLILLTDLPANEVAALPQFADQLFERLEGYFGQLPPTADGTDFQVTGHLMKDEGRFQSCGLLPNEDFPIRHGRHQNYQFWIRDQPWTYYRRHLALHEFVHCFMTCESGMQDIPPLWYIEGMAELFATHRVNAKGDANFAVLPDADKDFEGWGRITELQRLIASESARELRVPAIDVVLRETVASQTDSDYPVWWAACWLLNNNPRYQDSVQQLKPIKTRSHFLRAAQQLKQTHLEQLRSDWALFCESLTVSFDVQRSFPVHREQIPLSQQQAEMTLHVDKGWQDSGIVLAAGESVQLNCRGSYVVATQPADWVCQPQGVSVEYAHGLPLGQVVATFVSLDGDRLTNRMSVGTGADLKAPFASRLWLQVNDNANSRADNRGTVVIETQR